MSTRPVHAVSRPTRSTAESRPRSRQFLMGGVLTALASLVMWTPLSRAHAEPKPRPSQAVERGARASAGLQPSPKAAGAQVAAKIAASLPAATPEVWLGARLRGGDLDRIRVGDQAGLLKVASGDGTTDLYLKQDPRISIKALDTVLLARVTADDRHRILDALGVTEGEAGAVFDAISRHFDQLPQRSAVALLGVIAAAPERDLGGTAAAIRSFLSRTLLTSHDVSLRRQCVLALAVASATDEASVRSVIEFMSQSHNAWETFTTQQFFQYHGDYVRTLPSATILADALNATGNPYAPDILATLKK